MIQLLLPFVLCLPTAHAGASDRLAAKAEKAFEKENYDKALSRCSKALDKDSSNTRAAAVCGTVLYLWGISSQDQELADTGSTIMEGVALSSPGQPYLRLYRQIRSNEMMEAPNFPCGPEENAAWALAEEAFVRADYSTARKHYQVAAVGCENPSLWTNYGDTYFGEGDYKQAFMAYEHALEIDPYHWPALRFMGDGYIKQGDREEGLRWVARSLAANPVYEYAWGYVDSFLDPRVKQVRGTTLPRVIDGEVLIAMEEGLPPFTAEVTTIYQVAMQSAVAGGTAPERQINALSMTLSFVEEQEKLEEPGMELWALLSEAQDAGHFEDAVYVLLLSKELVPSFMDYRDAHMDSLTDYVLTLLD